MNVLVFDVGTSSLRGILFNSEGKVLTSSQVKYAPVFRSSARVEQDVMVFRYAVVQTGKLVADYALGNHCSIDALAVTAQRSAIIPLDKASEPLMPVIMWQDTRNAGICQKLWENNETVFSLSGAAVNTVFSGSKMTWIKRECPGIAGRTKRFVNIPEYLIYFMTGRFALDHTYGSRSNLMNLRKKEWDPQLLKVFGIEEQELSELVAPGTIVGTITEEFSQLSGIKEGTPVITSGGDQQCAAIGQGAIGEGSLAVVAGTGGFLTAGLDSIPEKLHVEDGLICNCSAIAGKYILEGNTLTCASAFDWFIRNFYGEITSYHKIDGLLEEMYEKEVSVQVLPYFQGRSLGGWNAEAKAAFADVTLSETRDDFLKALVESIFFEIRNAITLFKKYINIKEISTSGGMSKSRIMNQMQADAYHHEVIHRRQQDASATGALIVALTSLGVYKSPQEAFRRLTFGCPEEMFYPDIEKACWYERKRERMNNLYNSIYK